jgi:hypothetical protein
MIYNKQTLREKTLSMLPIEDRMKLDAGLIFTGVDDGENLFIGTEEQWKSYGLLQENYIQGDLEDLAKDNYLDK